ncbi:MAG: xanthine dehydrogenase family protein molybdopterin-binding subunit, partial [Chloroflexi bacterium]|nr:xanthine dehydrogenase family protein molybdopterin-binding subunit [Chloroflexota bacterium]
MTSNIVLKNKDDDFKVVGTRPIRHDGYDKVTGRALYGADMHLPGLLYGKVLRSPHAHARIKRIDTSKAEAHPDVRAVVTRKDFPEAGNDPVVLGSGPAVNLNYVIANVLAKDKALYKGHAVAAVAATSAHAAEEALKLIQVE